MEREIYKTLLDWKEDSTRKPLLLRGARQIGKTYIVNQFGNQEFKTFIVLNFERNPEYKGLFKDNDPKEIINRIILYTGASVQVGQTLIFLDEIQECPEAILALRYFREEMPKLHIIGAGSLLEFSLQAASFRMPVGRIQFLYMYPLSFREFLTALGQKALSKHITGTKALYKLEKNLHLILIEHVRKYFILGGMPEVVDSYITAGNILKCQQIQHAIIETYKADFSKYSKNTQNKYVQKVFNSIPTMIGQKVIFARIDKSTQAKYLREAFELLTTAGIFYTVKKTSGDGLPLEANAKSNFFKPIFLDIGLLHAMNGIYSQTIQEQNLTDIYKGAVAEQFVGQELLAYAPNYFKANLYYWVREARNSHAEIDFLIANKNEIIPIEVKSGTRGRLRSLIQYQKQYRTKNGIKISQAPYKKEPSLLSFPFYAIYNITK